MVTPGALRRLPDAGGAGRRAPSSRSKSSSTPPASSGRRREASSAWPRRVVGALRRRGALGDGGPRHACPESGARRPTSMRSVAFGLARVAGGHPRRPARAAPRADRADRPRQGRGRHRRPGAGGGVGDAQLAPHPARPQRVHGPTPRCERCLLADICPSAGDGRPAGEKASCRSCLTALGRRAFSRMIGRGSRACCSSDDRNRFPPPGSVRARLGSAARPARTTAPAGRRRRVAGSGRLARVRPSASGVRGRCGRQSPAGAGQGALHRVQLGGGLVVVLCGGLVGHDGQTTGELAPGRWTTTTARRWGRACRDDGVSPPASPPPPWPRRQVRGTRVKARAPSTHRVLVPLTRLDLRGVPATSVAGSSAAPPGGGGLPGHRDGGRCHPRRGPAPRGRRRAGLHVRASTASSSAPCGSPPTTIAAAPGAIGSRLTCCDALDARLRRILAYHRHEPAPLGDFELDGVACATWSPGAASRAVRAGGPGPVSLHRARCAPRRPRWPGWTSSRCVCPPAPTARWPTRPWRRRRCAGSTRSTGWVAPRPSPPWPSAPSRSPPST